MAFAAVASVVSGATVTGLRLMADCSSMADLL
jgi:hypothetical protein